MTAVAGMAATVATGTATAAVVAAAVTTAAAVVAAMTTAVMTTAAITTAEPRNPVIPRECGGPMNAHARR
jgi:hypothetical protein